MQTMKEYRVNLDTFSGPMDLLLHLVEEQEVDVRDVSISLLIKGYLSFLEDLGDIDINEAGDFLVMASYLMEIKSREILPREEIDLEETLDPRDNLVKQLLEYRQFRELGSRLKFLEKQRGMVFEKGYREKVDQEEEPTHEIEDLDPWILIEIYGRYVNELGMERTYKVRGERKPFREYIKELVQKMVALRKARFEELFNKEEGIQGIVGTFIAMLEIARRGYIQCFQPSLFAPIVVEWKGPEGASMEELLG